MAVDVKDKIIILLLVGALIAFLVTILTTVTIFEKNADHLEAVIKKEKPKSLKGYDKVKKWSFFAGLLLAVAAGVVKAVQLM